MADPVRLFSPNPDAPTSYGGVDTLPRASWIDGLVQAASKARNPFGMAWDSLPPNVRDSYKSGVNAVAELSPGAAVRDVVDASGEVGHGILNADPKAAGLGLASLATAAAGLVPGERLLAKGTQEAAPLIRAYHGTPHDFNKFDAAKIGTGEGAQAYGHGLYFAENERVAKQYREGLAGAPTPWQMQYGDAGILGNEALYDTWQRNGAMDLHSRLSVYKNPADPRILAEAKTHLENTIINGEAAKAENRRFFSQGGKEWSKWDDGELAAKRDALRLLNDPSFSVRPASTPGHMYEVGIHADPHKFLDWDAPVSGAIADRINPQQMGLTYRTAQPGTTEYQAFVNEQGRPLGNMQKGGDRANFERNWTDNLLSGTGRDLYQKLNNAPVASEALASAGVPGIRYLDGSSRAAGEGSRNVVVFPQNAELIEILRKYGLVPPAAAAAGGAALLPDPPQGTY